MSDICCNQVSKVDLFKLPCSELPGLQFAEGEKEAFFRSVGSANSSAESCGNDMNKQLARACHAHLAFMLAV